MYKILIIDDERPVRRAIKILGKWEEYQIHTILEAVDGQNGLDLLQEYKPEIVLVDMKMPIMNGVDFLINARKICPNAKYIVISGYNDFEYTKQAIKSKVLDYLLKPIVEFELNAVLAKAIYELKLEEEKVNKELSKGIIQNISLPLVKEKVYISVIDEEGTSRLVDEYKLIANINEKASFYGFTVLRIINFKEVCRLKFNNDANLVYFSVINVINDLCSEWCESFSFKNNKVDYEVIIAIEVIESNKNNFENMTIQCINKIIETLEKLFGIYTISAIGDYYSEFNFLHKSYLDAEEKLNSINLLNSTQTVISGTLNDTKSKRISLVDKKELLINAFESGSIEYTKKIINEYFKQIKDSGCFTIEDAHKATLEFVIMLDDIMYQLGISSIRKQIHCFENGQLIVSFNEFEKFCEFIIQSIEEVYSSITGKLKNSEKAIVHNIKEYIDKNYFNEIKLSLFSEKHYLSKEHLCREFKETFECGIYEYALKIRMEKAKEMLDDEEMKIQVVSETVGYSDSNYFSKAFKKYYGISPSTYRTLNIKS